MVSGNSRITSSDRAEAERGHAEETRAPAECRLQDAAERGRHDRRERRDRAHAGELAAGAHPVIEIADDGARQHRRAGDAQRLQAAQRDQHLDRGREHAAQADRDVERQRGEQHRLAADMIGDRSKHDLADGEAEQVARQASAAPAAPTRRTPARAPAARADRGRPTSGRPRSAAPATRSAPECRDAASRSIRLRRRKFIRPMRNDGPVSRA